MFRRAMALAFACVIAVLAVSCGKKHDPGSMTDPVEISEGALGSKTNPVRCDMPDGERAYLSRLRDAEGKGPTFSRIGSFGTGPHGNALDGYEVESSTTKYIIFMDMYHEGHVETNAVPGFTIINE